MKEYIVYKQEVKWKTVQADSENEAVEAAGDGGWSDGQFNGYNDSLERVWAEKDWGLANG